MFERQKTHQMNTRSLQARQMFINFKNVKKNLDSDPYLIVKT